MSAQFRTAPRKRRHPRRRRNRLLLEQLETRRLLATLVVTSVEDAVDSNPGDGVCEISSGGLCTLRAAIQEANALPNSSGPDQISLPTGTYTLSLGGSDEQLAATGDLDITEDLVLQGAGAADTIIDGAGIDRVIDVVRGSVLISGVTIRGGLIQDDDGTVESSGGGIRNEGDLTITQSTVTGNISPLGAGIANYNGILRISSSVISGNGDASTRRGGGLANYSNYDPASLEISDTTITNNRADIGGGINNDSYDGLATATISRSTISGNTASNGGGISNRSIAYYYDTVAANLTIRGSTISGNTADSSGGGIHNEAGYDSIALVDVANSTITANTATAGDGGGILSAPAATATIQSVILGGNSAGGEGPDLASDSATAAFSLIQNAAGHSIVDGVNNNIVGEDPLLAPLDDNGGPTLTHTVLPGSPVVDQGSNPDLLANDQRGTAFARTVDDSDVNDASDGTDIGAVESGQVPLPLVADLSLTLGVNDANPALGQDVTFTITLANAGPDHATNVEVTDFLPFELLFTGSTVSQGDYDDLDGIWFVGDLNAGASALLNVTATVDSTDSVTYSVEVTASDQIDPDSTPDNDVGSEDDQSSVQLGSCLTSESIRVGMNRLTYSCATPGSLSAFVRGSQRGSQTFPLYDATVDIADAQEIAVAVADSNGVAVAFVHLTEADLDQTILVQAFEMAPNARKSNTLSLDVGVRRYPTSNTNPVESLDVNRDTIVSALDALTIINSLNQDPDANASSVWVGADDGNVIYLDTNADFRVSALDALLIINHLSHAQATIPGGEAVHRTGSTASPTPAALTAQTGIPSESSVNTEATRFVSPFAPMTSPEHNSPPLEPSDAFPNEPNTEFESGLTQTEPTALAAGVESDADQS